MKKIVFYCGVEGDNFANAYVKNSREYLKMNRSERLAALTEIIGELTQELKFVAGQINAQGSLVKIEDLPQ